ncbi:DUF2158 domain-containing protein [uncultured Chryseobacterium sp.]|uniref:DUF2158 domain-containing protein n=1 Tax=uncultured Chryseobacterium sp. TaxID=259322 RepID=UPI0025DC2A47|nr:DUF2158 domain-containing protein [uncultured Chryseobacterium sp.]
MIEKGTVVQLKSGGPEMTVKGESDYGWVCTWFLHSEVKEFTFVKEQLNVVR